MNLGAMLERLIDDPFVGPAHIALYVVIVSKVDLHGRVFFRKKELMDNAKIKSKTTFHQVIQLLHKQGYLVYKPSRDLKRRLNEINLLNVRV